MAQRISKNLRDRVHQSAHKLLQRSGAVGPLELLEELGFLAHPHVQQWRQGNPEFDPLEPYIQCGHEKLQKTYRLFLEWVSLQKLEPFEATYASAGRTGAQPLQISSDGNPETELFLRTHFRPADLTDAKKRRLEQKFNKVPDLLVYQMTGEASKCHDCCCELERGDLIFLEDRDAICLRCADMDHLEFLPSGNAAMTRRAKKLSPLSAILMKFNRRRKCYQRQGILVSSAAIDAAEEQCAADAGVRAERRLRSAEKRAQQDVTLVEEMTKLIQAEFPGCPVSAARSIAHHTAERGSGRVGRSAAGRELQSEAIRLAVVAHIRHQHTDYDELLMRGVQRQEARRMIRDTLTAVIDDWQTRSSDSTPSHLNGRRESERLDRSDGKTSQP